MKNCLLLFMLILCMNLSAQSVRGLYQGKLFNDTTKMFQNYELALSEYKGKIMGYSYTTFVSNDTFYYGVRRVKGRIEGDNLIVVDAEFIGHNYPEPPAKGVKRTSVIPLKGQDSVVALNGRWQTNESKRHRYYSIPGSMDLKKTEDSSASALISHLKQMNVLREASQTGDVAAAKPKGKGREDKGKTTAITTDPSKTDVAKTDATNTDVAKGDETKTEETKTEVARTDSRKNTKSKIDSKPKAETVALVKTEPAKPVITRMAPELRKQNVLPPVDVASDSIVLAFYDNGIIDGDSVSVYLDGKNILSSTKLTSFATKKTVYLPNTDGEYKLMLVAENLGTLPPNTGLLVVKDGDKSHQMNFSADLVTNATLIIRKKKK